MATADATAQAGPAKPETARPNARRHRFLVGTVFTLAVIVAVFAVLAVWTNRQVLNTNNFTKTSSQILADKTVQTALSAYLVNQLFSSVDVEQELKTNLPAQLQGLAGPVASGLKQVAGQAAPRLLASPQFQAAFQQAVRAAHSTFVKIVNGGGNLASTKNGVVTLNLHALVTQLAADLGLSSQLAAVRAKAGGSAGQAARATAQQKLGVTIPSSSGQLVIMRSSQLKTVQDIAGGIKSLAVALPLIAVALFMAAISLAVGRRRRALRTTGWCFFTIGLVVLLIRRYVGNHVVNSLVKVQSNRPAVHDIWTIGTTLLYDIAIAMIFYGIVLVICAWIGGPTRPATALRRALAPRLRDHPFQAYAGVAVIYALLLIWGPTPAFRQLIPLLIFAALFALGMFVLRRSTAREFPDAQAGDTMRALRGWWAARREPPQQPVAAAGNGQRVDELERLAALHDKGDLSDDEYAAEKTLVLKAH